eukprot:4672612-Pyramimonas_sp.AAC.1
MHCPPAFRRASASTATPVSAAGPALPCRCSRPGGGPQTRRGGTGCRLPAPASSDGQAPAHEGAAGPARRRCRTR